MVVVVSSLKIFFIQKLFSSLFLFFVRTFATIVLGFVLAGLVKVLDEVGHIVIVVFLVDGLLVRVASCGRGRLLSCTHAGGQPLEVLQRLGSQLVEDARQHLGDLFGLRLAR